MLYRFAEENRTGLRDVAFAAETQEMTRSITVFLCIGCLAMTGCGFGSWLDYERTKRSLKAVQVACSEGPQGDSNGIVDGWGNPLVIEDVPGRGFVVVSRGKDGRLDGPMERYWDEDVRGQIFSVDDDVVCANNVLVTWPPLTDHDESVYKLPRVPTPSK